MQAALARQRGELTAADEAMTEAAALGTGLGLPESDLVVSAHLFFETLHRGGLAAVHGALDALIAEHPRLSILRMAAALAAVHAGERSTAAAALRLAVAPAPSTSCTRPCWAWARWWLWPPATGDQPPAARRRPRALRRDGDRRRRRPRPPSVPSTGTAPWWPGCGAGPTTAEELARRAVALADTMGATVWSLWSRAELAAALIAGGTGPRPADLAARGRHRRPRVWAWAARRPPPGASSGRTSSA